MRIAQTKRNASQTALLRRLSPRLATHSQTHTHARTHCVNLFVVGYDARLTEAHTERRERVH